MPSEWHELTALTRGESFTVERVRLSKSRIAIEGEFTPPPLSQLSADDQVFVMAFLRSHGSIKEMERVFGVSYPTVKNRLTRISGQLPLVEIETRGESGASEILERLRAGEIDAEEAIRRLST